MTNGTPATAPASPSASSSLDGKRALVVGICVGLVLVALTVAVDYYIRRRAAPQVPEQASEWLEFQDWKRAKGKAVDNGGQHRAGSPAPGPAGESAGEPTGPDIGASPIG